MSAFEADRFNHSRTSPRRTKAVVGALRCMTKAVVIPKRAEEAAFPTTHMWRAVPFSLPTISKERLQHFRAASREHSALNFHRMVQLRMIYHLHHRMHRPSFGII